MKHTPVQAQTNHPLHTDPFSTFAGFLERPGFHPQQPLHQSAIWPSRSPCPLGHSINCIQSEPGGHLPLSTAHVNLFLPDLFLIIPQKFEPLECYSFSSRSQRRPLRALQLCKVLHVGNSEFPSMEPQPPGTCDEFYEQQKVVSQSK